nr:hypothetical protein CFP56_53579 [Quercus suber]
MQGLTGQMSYGLTGEKVRGQMLLNLHLCFHVLVVSVIGSVEWAIKRLNDRGPIITSSVLVPFGMRRLLPLHDAISGCLRNAQRTGRGNMRYRSRTDAQGRDGAQLDAMVDPS